MALTLIQPIFLDDPVTAPGTYYLFVPLVDTAGNPVTVSVTSAYTLYGYTDQVSTQITNFTVQDYGSAVLLTVNENLQNYMGLRLDITNTSAGTVTVWMPVTWIHFVSLSEDLNTALSNQNLLLTNMNTVLNNQSNLQTTADSIKSDTSIMQPQVSNIDNVVQNNSVALNTVDNKVTGIQTTVTQINAKLDALPAQIVPGVVIGNGTAEYLVTSAMLLDPSVPLDKISVFVDVDGDGNYEQLTVRDPSTGFQTPVTYGYTLALSQNNPYPSNMVTFGVIDRVNDYLCFSLEKDTVNSVLRLKVYAGSVDSSQPDYFFNTTPILDAPLNDSLASYIYSNISSMQMLDIWEEASGKYYFALSIVSPTTNYYNVYSVDLVNSTVNVQTVNFTPPFAPASTFVDPGYASVDVDSDGERMILGFNSYTVLFFDTSTETATNTATLDFSALLGYYPITYNFSIYYENNLWIFRSVLINDGAGTSEYVKLEYDKANNVWTKTQLKDMGSYPPLYNVAPFRTTGGIWVFAGLAQNATNELAYVVQISPSADLIPDTFDTIVPYAAGNLYMFFHENINSDNSLLFYGADFAASNVSFRLLTNITYDFPDEVILDRNNSKFIFEAPIEQGKPILYSVNPSVTTISKPRIVPK